MLERMCPGLCVHTVNHTGKTHVRKVGQSAASLLCFFPGPSLVQLRVVFSDTFQDLFEQRFGRTSSFVEKT